MESVKIAVMGDGAVGKTSLLQTFAMHHFPGDYVPSIFDNYSCEVNIDQKTVTLTLWDSIKQDLLPPPSSSTTSLPSLVFYENDVILLLFSVTSPASFSSISETWLRKLQTQCTNTPIILVGTKRDLRTNPQILERLHKRNMEPISYEMGEQKAKEIGAVAYIEISSLTGYHIKHLFDVATRIGMHKSKPGSSQPQLISRSASENSSCSLM